MTVRTKLVYIDNRDKQHDTEKAAERANLLYRAEDVVGESHYEVLKRLSGMNYKILEPLIEYLQLLYDESKERVEKYGGRYTSDVQSLNTSD